MSNNGSKRIKVVMIPRAKVITVLASKPLKDAAELMIKHKVSCLVVIAEEKKATLSGDTTFDICTSFLFVLLPASVASMRAFFLSRLDNNHDASHYYFI